MSQLVQQPGAWSALFEWSVGHHFAKLHVCEVCKALECLAVMRSGSKLSVRSLQKIIIFIIYENIFWIKVSKKIINLMLKTEALVMRQLPYVVYSFLQGWGSVNFSSFFFMLWSYKCVFWTIEMNTCRCDPCDISAQMATLVTQQWWGYMASASELVRCVS